MLREINELPLGIEIKEKRPKTFRRKDDEELRSFSGLLLMFDIVSFFIGIYTQKQRIGRQYYIMNALHVAIIVLMCRI
jgi:hypothetical protein